MPLRSQNRFGFLVAILAATGSLLSPASNLRAQGIASSAIGGVVRASDGSDVESAVVTVVNTATGYVQEAEVRHGRFLVPGLEVGGPYTVVVERLGFRPRRKEGVYLRLGVPVELEFVLQPAAVAVDPVTVDVAPYRRALAHGGVATTVSDSLIHRLPTLDRNLYDFVHLAPQISTKVGLAGISGGGVGFRFNNFLVNGVPQRSSSGSQPREFAGARSLPFDAVSEYQILVAPYDVRYGDFAGALINAVTRSGTNRIQGSAFAYGRNDALSREGDAAPYERVQYGFSLGGPILRDRLHFFVAPELQHFTSPAPGPYVGQPSTALPAVPVTAADLGRLEEVMRGHGLAAGSGGAVENENPQANLFARLDAALPEWSSRAVLWTNHARSEDSFFARDEGDVFPLSTNRSAAEFTGRTTALQLQTEVGGAGHNELLVSYRRDQFEGVPDVRQPIVRVAVPSTTGDLVTIVTGTPAQAQGSGLSSQQIYFRDDFTLQLGGSHVASFGFEAERFDLERHGVPGSYGDWTFSSLDSLERGIAERFEVRRPFAETSVAVRGGQYAAYFGDRWQVGERISLTMGVRADLLDITDHAPYNPVVDSIFGRRTDEMPHRRVHLSPRLGFTWDGDGTARDGVRGGIGVFTGRPPLAWVHAALLSYGVGVGVLRCGERPTDSGEPPPFEPDYREAPTACADGPGLTAAPRGDVDLLARDLRMARTLRASVAYDRRLPWDLVATGEVLLTRNISDFVFVNLNLEGPQGVDRHGRVLYGGPIGPTGQVAPAVRSDFSEVIDLRNTSKNRSAQLSARLEKRLSRGAAAVASYTYSTVRDVQTPLRVNNPAIVNWASRAVSGRHEDLTLENSLNDVPHRVVLAGTVTAPWERWSTVLSFYYVGESGSPFTYRAWGTGQRGDLNADGSNVNDPIYVPRDALDPSEITFSGRSDAPDADNSAAAQTERVSRQQADFERLVEATPCLRRQRGGILERNSCREPWSHTTVLSVRQAIPVGRHAVEAQLDVFNVLDLLSDDWGRYRVAAPALLEHVGQTEGPPETTQPVFRFDTTAPEWTTLETESAYQIQLALRYRF